MLPFNEFQRFPDSNSWWQDGVFVQEIAAIKRLGVLSEVVQKFNGAAVVHEVVSGGQSAPMQRVIGRSGSKAMIPPHYDIPPATAIMREGFEAVSRKVASATVSFEPKLKPVVRVRKKPKQSPAAIITVTGIFAALAAMAIFGGWQVYGGGAKMALPSTTAAKAANIANTGRIVMDSGDGKHCIQMVFDNRTNQMANAGPAECPTGNLQDGATAVPSSISSRNARMDAIRETFSSH
jgi:hypothetical protein